MEQNSKGKKTFNKKYYNKNGKGKGNNKNAAAHGGENNAATEPLKMKKEMPQNPAPAHVRKPSYKSSARYSGSFDLADSFEAEEKKKASEASSYDDRNDKRKNKDGQTEQRVSERHSDRNRSSRNGSRNENKNGYKKNRKPSADSDLERDDGLIKTRPFNEYIPFETPDDYETEDFSALYEENDYSEPSYKKRGERRDDRRSSDSMRETGGVPGAVVGRNAVRELLRSERSVDKLYVKSGSREGSIVVIVAEAISKKIPIVEVSGDKLDQLAGGPHHQGVVALAAEKQYTDIESILKIAKDRNEKPLIVIADGIEDPQNLGAMIRCAECAGVHGIIIPKRRAVGLTPIVTKASAGAIEHMAIAKVANLNDAMEKLKKAGLWIFAAEAGGTPYYEADFNVPAAIVFGSEGFGVSRLVREHSDFTVSIPMYGHVNSLNVSTAASVILCHAARMQRT